MKGVIGMEIKAIIFPEGAFKGPREAGARS